MLGWGTLHESSTVIVWHKETVMSRSQGSSPAFPWEEKRVKVTKYISCDS